MHKLSKNFTIVTGLNFLTLFSCNIFPIISCTPKKETFVNSVKICILSGDITNQGDTVDAIVNPANQELKRGGNVCGKIFEKAGTGLEQECKNILHKSNDKKVPAGFVTVTDGYDLKTNIVHVVLPNFNPDNLIQPSILFDQDGKKLLEKSYFNLLNLAVCEGFKKIAIPFLCGSNFCRVPSDRGELASIAISSVLDFCKRNAKNNNSLAEIRFILYDKDDFDLFANEFDNIFA